MFNGMHTQSRKRLNISISVVKTVNLLVQRTEVKKTMSKVKMNASPHWNSHHC
jgi:hypothetical protein